MARVSAIRRQPPATRRAPPDVGDKAGAAADGQKRASVASPWRGRPDELPRRWKWRERGEEERQREEMNLTDHGPWI
ncbi:hypothetical protein U9M48_041465 [Paspalum notatum var. saurae]|uniref:Uncharacterized protein n=1 Tax=Paspalum notatum var. saurae TaxID=547442 RepID=A0AAQ3UQL8_PASNO